MSPGRRHFPTTSWHQQPEFSFNYALPSSISVLRRFLLKFSLCYYADYRRSSCFRSTVPLCAPRPTLITMSAPKFMGLTGHPLALAVSTVATTGFLLFGYDQGVMSGM